MKTIIYLNRFKVGYLDHYRIIHSIKTAIACLIGLALEKYYNWPSGQWVPITIMVVMSAQTRFGGALRKAYMRFLGTVAGVTITAITLLLFGTNLITMFIVVFLACLCFTYIASNKGDINYAGTLGGVTVLLTLTATNTDVYVTIQRGLYIAIGIIIALFMSRFFFPIHARDLFRFSIGNTLHNLQKLYASTIKMHIEKNQQVADPNLETIIIENLAEQPRLIFEACTGSRAFAAKKELFNAILNSEKRIHRFVNLLYGSLAEIHDQDYLKTYLNSLHELHLTIEQELDNLAKCFEAANTKPIAINIDEGINKITKLVEKIPKQEAATELIAKHSVLFFMEQILKEIANLYHLTHKAYNNMKKNAWTKTTLLNNGCNE